MSIKLTKREKAELAECKQTFVIFTKGRNRPGIDEVFYFWCRQTNNPYLEVHLRRTYADISMDLPNGSGLLDTEGKDQFRALCVSLGCHEKGKCFEIPTLRCVPREIALKIAPLVVEIGFDFCRRNPAERCGRTSIVK